MQWISEGKSVRHRKICAAATSLLLLGGCDSDGEEHLPGACRASEANVRAALSDAPGRVELDGVRLSGCLVKSSNPAELQDVGALYLDAAAALAGAAAKRPEGAAALQLGYLVGAVGRGAERTQGIHSELVRRLEQEAASLADSSGTYARGRRAGARSG
jgi:hypothetical protein